MVSRNLPAFLFHSSFHLICEIYILEYVEKKRKRRPSMLPNYEDLGPLAEELCVESRDVRLGVLDSVYAKLKGDFFYF